MYRMIAGLTGIAVALAACSSSSSGAAPKTARADSHGISGAGPSPDGCHADITPQICVTISVTGTETVAGTAQTTAPAPPEASPKITCAQLATWHDTEMDLGGNVPALAGHAVEWDQDLGSFHGPGTYDLTRSGFHLDIDGKSFQAYHDRKASVSVQPDFAVTYAFSGLTSESGSISGSLRWTCVDPV
jgi:hypothetical protein